jgi:hypothetical protein
LLLASAQHCCASIEVGMQFGMRSEDWPCHYEAAIAGRSLSYSVFTTA